MQVTDSRFGPSSTASNLYSGDQRFESQLGHRLTDVFRAFPKPLQANAWQHLKLSTTTSIRILPNSLFIRLSNHWLYAVWNIDVFKKKHKVNWLFGNYGTGVRSPVGNPAAITSTVNVAPFSRLSGAGDNFPSGKSAGTWSWQLSSI
jgi:hypothetical protein